MSRPHGFSLLELVLSLLLLALGSVVIATQFAQGARGLASDETLQTAAQLAQRCAEHLLGIRRRAGYAAVASATCPPLPAPLGALGYAQSLTLATLATPPCPSGVACLQAEIRISRQGAPASTLHLLLAEY